MKLHIVSNAPWASTGYANQTKIFAPRIKALGHEVSLTSFWGLDGGMLNWQGMQVFPRGHHPYGQDMMAANAAQSGADLMISLMDAWVCEPQLYGNVRWAPWYPVDSEPLPQLVKQKVQQAYARIVYSKFGERMTHAAGLDCYYVPHGVESKMFQPLDTPKAELLERLGWPKDKFIVGMVAANKGNPSRKAFVENLEAFAMLKQKRKDAWLYLHTARSENGEYEGVNLPEYLAHLGMQEGKDYGFPNQYNLLIGFPNDYMVAAYNAMDVHLLVSMGEGFGIPILEAQACGTPVIVGDWTSMGELCFEGWKIPKGEAHKVWTPLAAMQYAARPEAIADALGEAYEKAAGMGKQAREGALAYDADVVTESYWKPVLSALETRIERESKKSRKKRRR
ncbi:MAG: glycosyltransferase family 4 protein [Anaerolineales bacterium]|nr:MAG: glycosyltransferase family 4 protein [Anaerolineales bacterium]